MKLSLACAALALALLPILAGADQEKRLTITDIHGKTIDPFAGKDTKAAVFVFVSTDCPIANFYQPTLRKLAATYSEKGVPFFQVHPDPELTPAAARKHAREFDVTVPVVIDTRQALVKRLDAKVTPEAFVVTPGGAIAYRGRIDDTYTTYGKRRPEPTSRDLAAALDAVLAGRTVAVPKTTPVGCHIFVETP